ncbi:MAG: hypothetical protein WBC61_04275, partial [Dehalococcoidia bacterium]
IILIAISTTTDENAVFGITQFTTPFVVSPSALLRTGLSNHERPFDRLRVNGRKPIFGTKVAKAIQRGIGRL